MVRNLLIAILFIVGTPAQAEPYPDTWGLLLGEAVTEGQVDYGKWRNNPQFDQLVTQIAIADTAAMSEQEKLVFYINAYNILAARGILDGSSPSSLLGRYIYFKHDKYEVAGRRINLYELEHELIRPLGEPRIHFAIVCASESCPILRSEPYTLDQLDEQLNDAARVFINDTERNRFDTTTGVAEVSMIFKWFDEDFIAARGSVQDYLSDFVQDPEAALLLSRQEFRLKHLKYDWNLNGKLR